MPVSWTDDFAVDHIQNGDYTDLTGGVTVDGTDYVIESGRLQTTPSGHGNTQNYVIAWEDQRNLLTELPLTMSATFDNLLSTVPGTLQMGFVDLAFDAAILCVFSLGNQGPAPVISGFAWEIVFTGLSGVLTASAFQGDTTLDWTWGGGGNADGGSLVTIDFGIDATGLLTITTTDGLNYSHDLNIDNPGFVDAFNAFTTTTHFVSFFTISYS